MKPFPTGMHILSARTDPVVRTIAILLTGLTISCLPVVASGTMSAAVSDSLPRPSPSLTPVEVVRTQVEALKENNKPFDGAGVETAYRFASPKSRAETGELKHFRALFASPRYGPMLDHITAEYSEPQVEGDVARVGVIVITETGDRVSYLFQLKRHRYPPYEDCWMTDAVVPVKKEDRTSVGT